MIKEFILTKFWPKNGFIFWFDDIWLRQGNESTTEWIILEQRNILAKFVKNPLYCIFFDADIYEYFEYYKICKINTQRDPPVKKVHKSLKELDN